VWRGGRFSQWAMSLEGLGAPGREALEMYPFGEMRGFGLCLGTRDHSGPRTDAPTAPVASSVVMNNQRALGRRALPMRAAE